MFRTAMFALAAIASFATSALAPTSASATGQRMHLEFKPHFAGGGGAGKVRFLAHQAQSFGRRPASDDWE
jgi:hypothetical protein